MEMILGRSRRDAADGQADPWAGFAPGEDHEFHDPVQARFDVYRGMVWVQIQIGTWWVLLLEVLGLALVLGALVLGFVPVAIIGLIAWIGFGLVVDRATPSWAEDHNARVKAAMELERASAARTQADDLAWRMPSTDASPEPSAGEAR